MLQMANTARRPAVSTMQSAPPTLADVARVAGVSCATASRVLLELDQLGVPIVLAGRPIDPRPGLSYVDADNTGGAERAVRYLLDQGRTSIATVAGPTDMNAGVDRLIGYRKALAAAGVSDS